MLTRYFERSREIVERFGGGGGKCGAMATTRRLKTFSAGQYVIR